MPVNIHIAGEHAKQALDELRSLTAGLLGRADAPTSQTPVAPPPPPQPASEPEKPAAKATRGRPKKADKPETTPAKTEEAEAESEEKSGEAENSVEAPADAPDLDANDVRGCISLVNACKDMTAARGLLSKFDAKKVSDIKKEHFAEVVEQTAELLEVEFGPALRAAKVQMLLTKLDDSDEHKALKEKFGGPDALTIGDDEFTALEEAAG
jgi:type IV secretory pathway VirB10-like protein